MTGILVTGTSSDAGKSLVVTGLCRALRRRGIDVAPFKAQNMSNNSMVVADGEIGRAQYLQAVAARVEPTTAMNPVLIKPGTDRRAHVVLRGQPDGTLEAGQYATGRGHLAAAAFESLRELEAAHELVVCEGAGSPAEVNLRSGDYVNMGLARQFGMPVVLVGDIDRGGVLASIYGTWALLDDADRGLLKGYVINKFRGDPEVLAPGLTRISELTGLANFGVLNWLEGVWLDGEDALAIGAWHRAGTTPHHAERALEVAVVRLPRVSNATDVDALAAEPGVHVTVTADPAVCARADLLVLPGTRATIDDLAWLRARGIDRVVAQRHAAGRATLGICGGYQMLGKLIVDEVEQASTGSATGKPAAGRSPTTHEPVEGLDLLPLRVDFHPGKVLARPTGSWQGHQTIGYEIHHGRPTTLAEPDERFLDGMRVGPTWGTHWHGALEHDEFRRAWLTRVADQAGHPWRPTADAPGFGALRERMIETLADAIEEQLDVDALLALTHPTPEEN
ncbi:adenosylcobyric acid synthase (glutamine-hydrolysing) [Luteococcus japonicus]|uniref:Cobyric acid synthase n=1 Tax=Luteococcus japonicus TaxID=33984 RepID=A0A3N1ZVY6_9ACTN|nr:cobyric acid synthase [Luteococcus japonicus]ROR55014.1 adenosylcobyric acid synthase (glutamine-hydrolysing) [Luteococcus japonicus]